MDKVDIGAEYGEESGVDLGVGSANFGGGGSKNTAVIPNLREGALPPGGKLGLLLNRGLKGNASGVLNATSTGLYTAKRQIIDSAKTLPKKAGRKLRRGLVGAAGAIPLAMLAAGVGATTGDASKTATLLVTAGKAGSSITNYYGDKFTKGIGKSTDSARIGFWGTDLKKINQAQFDRAIINSPELMNALTQTLGRKEAKEAINNKDVQALLSNNITDPKKIAKALKLKKKIKTRKGFEKDDKALQHAVAMAMWDRDVNPAIFNNFSRERTIFKENLFKQLEVQGLPTAEINKQIDQILDDLSEFEN